jgi:phosphoglycolate phosphatase
VDKSEVIEKTLTLLGNPNKKGVVMVGDRKHDIIGAHKVGIQAIGVLYGYGSIEELEDADADGLADDLDELEEILLEWFKG